MKTFELSIRLPLSEENKAKTYFMTSNHTELLTNEDFVCSFIRKCYMKDNLLDEFTPIKLTSFQVEFGKRHYHCYGTARFQFKNLCGSVVIMWKDRV